MLRCISINIKAAFQLSFAVTFLINTCFSCPTHLKLYIPTFRTLFLERFSDQTYKKAVAAADHLCLRCSEIWNQTMLTCISCSKQVAEGDDAAALRIKEAAKSFATQIKEMAQKLKPRAGSGLTPAAWDINSRQIVGGRQPVTAEDMMEKGPKEWIAQVEPGVHITFAALLDGGNDLTRIRFSREMFDKWQAQRWWSENYDKILELYNVRRFNRQALQTPIRSEDDRDSSYSRLGSARDCPTMTPRENYRNYGCQSQVGSSTYGYAASTDTSRTMTSSRDEVSVSVCSKVGSEWVEQDEPGVYITIRQMVDGTRELRRIRFSRERFVEVDAKQWWEENRDRIQSQYL